MLDTAINSPQTGRKTDDQLLAEAMEHLAGEMEHVRELARLADADVREVLMSRVRGLTFPSAGAVKLSLASEGCWLRGKWILLKPREHRVLAILIASAGVVSYQYLHGNADPGREISHAELTAVIGKLRLKLGHNFILTYSNWGYGLAVFDTD